MKRIDLHVHTTASDSTASPAEAVRLAKEAGLSAIAITDHDTVSGYAEAADIVSSGSIDFVMALPGLGVAVLGIAAAFFWYTRKDIL